MFHHRNIVLTINNNININITMTVRQHQRTTNDNVVHRHHAYMVNMFIRLFLLRQQHQPKIFFREHNHFRLDNVIDIQQVSVRNIIKHNTKKMTSMIMFLSIRKPFLIPIFRRFHPKYISIRKRRIRFLMNSFGMIMISSRFHILTSMILFQIVNRFSLSLLARKIFV